MTMSITLPSRTAPAEAWVLDAIRGPEAQEVMLQRLWGKVAMAVSRALVVAMVDGDRDRGRWRLHHVKGALYGTDTWDTQMMPLFRAAETVIGAGPDTPPGFEPTKDEEMHYFAVTFTALGLLLVAHGEERAVAACKELGIAVPPWRANFHPMPGGTH